MNSSWKVLEGFVRSVASLRYGMPCQAEHVGGVDVDGVVHLGADEKVIIEITENMTLAKVREDITKIAAVRLGLLTRGISCKAFVVLEGEPTSSMVELGTASHVSVLSAKKFEGEFFDYESYVTLRRVQPFGSAVDSETGQNDQRSYIEVALSESDTHKSWGVRNVCEALKRGEKIVAIGDYGTGKSRLVREVFEKLSDDARNAGAYAIAINLRDHWGSGNILEILGGHLKRIGVSGSIDNAMRLLASRGLILLLDGFDEIGAQSHDTQLIERAALRRSALRGVRDLVLQSGAGVLITGRSHYFDDDKEILDALGLGASAKARILEVPPNFTAGQARAYLQNIGLDIDPPNWLPMKPLVFQIAAELDPGELEKILRDVSGTFEFWGVFLGAVTRRESRGVQNTISPYTIRQILVELGGLSRRQKEYLGRFRPSDINEAYRLATGDVPDAVGQQLLARMCTLGRIEPQSPDRQFLDANIAEVIRAEHLVAKIATLDSSVTRSKWTRPLLVVGIMHAAAAVMRYDMDQLCHTMLNKFATSANAFLLGEIVSIMTIIEPEVDFKALTLSHGFIPMLFLKSSKISNLEIVACEISVLVIDLKTVGGSKNLSIKNSIIMLVSGVSSSTSLPAWIRATDVIDYDENVSNTASIKGSEIPEGQKLLLSIIHKIFFQPGNGREEAALLKGGFGKKFSSKTVDDILRKMLSEGLITVFKGDDGRVYSPVRRYTERMARIKGELALSEDPLWAWAAGLR